jgi:cysteine desulfurase
MPAEPIYLDHNATAPMLPEVADALREASLRFSGNPASQHAAGRDARRALEAARDRAAELLGARRGGMDADQVIFTSGGTEANNLALYGLLGASPQPRPSLVGASAESTSPRLIISTLEHPSIARTAAHLAASGTQVDYLPADASGVIRMEPLSRLATRNSQLVSIMLASNETGVLQPVAEIAAICRERGVLVHTDAVQAVGKIPVDFRALGVDALSCTAHKFHGPLGIGALIVRHGVSLDPLMFGGFQQAGLRPGTESVALAVGMVAALEAWAREANSRRSRLSDLRDQLERTLRAADPAAVVVGAAAPRLPHTSNIAFVGLDRQAIVMALDLAGVACSTGSACASGSSEPSPALVAMGLPEEQISGSVRFSLGAATTAAEIDEAARRILNVCNNLRRR